MTPPHRADSPPDVSAADAVLAAIPFSLLLGAVGAFALSLSLAQALALGSLPATGSIGYALFYDPPGGAEA